VSLPNIKDLGLKTVIISGLVSFLFVRGLGTIGCHPIMVDIGFRMVYEDL
jgi:hypothetical protein